jgi:hypothetical protein
MRRFEPEWFIAGGWAIDLFLGKETRRHEDIEIALFRRDQAALQDYLAGWLLQKVGNGALAVWKRGERLELPVFEIHFLAVGDGDSTLAPSEALAELGVKTEKLSELSLDSDRILCANLWITKTSSILQKHPKLSVDKTRF